MMMSRTGTAKVSVVRIVRVFEVIEAVRPEKTPPICSVLAPVLVVRSVLICGMLSPLTWIELSPLVAKPMVKLRRRPKGLVAV